MSARDVIAGALCMFGTYDTHGRNTEADAILAALHAAGFVVERGWQPIETAPRDGTRFHGWFPPCSQAPKGVVMDVLWSGGWYHPFFIEPTYWRPLPTPPEAQP